MKTKITNTEWVLLFIGAISTITFFITGYENLLWLSIGVFGNFNFSWYFSGIIDAKPQYSYKGSTYSVEGHCEFKHPETRVWVSAVIYADKNGHQYTREIYEFYRLFRKV